jgi:hypothetical protein
MNDALRTQQQLLELRKEAAPVLMKYPGVFGVGLGLKERGGQVTDEVAFRVYVDEKKAASLLRAEETIPSEYKGVPTDVLKKGRSVPMACDDHQQHDPLIGGITISTLVLDATNHVFLGTVGFFATIDGATAPRNIALVTNQHVVNHQNEAVGATVYQPSWVPGVGNTFDPLAKNGDTVGTILKMAGKADHHFKYPDGTEGDYYVDAASVKLDFCISSWCHTNCGNSFANEVQGLRLNNSDAIADVAQAQNGDTVYKVGRSTGRTVGRITDIVFPPIINDGSHGSNVIQIKATQMSTPDNCGGVLRFGDQGDSGAALINEQNKLIGLMYAYDPDNPTLAYACHIHPVLDALQVTAITTANPVHGNPAASGMSAEMEAIMEGRPNLTAVLRARFLGCPEGQRVAALIDRHRHQVIHLVNNNRRVAVVWRRNQGPAFLNRAINNARDPEIKIPQEIEGVTVATLLRNMARILTEYGSSELAEAMAQHLDETLANCSRFDSLHDLVDEMAERQPA